MPSWGEANTFQIPNNYHELNWYNTVRTTRRAKLGKILGGCRGPAKIRQGGGGGFNNFLTFYAIKISVVRVSMLSDKIRFTFKK